MKNETESLNQTILLLKTKRAKDLQLLKDEFNQVQENLKPINLLKSTYHEITTAPDLKHNLVNVGMGLTTGYLSRKAIFGASRNPIKMILGVLVQFAITNIVSKHSESIKSAGQSLFQRFVKYRMARKSEFHQNGTE